MEILDQLSKKLKNDFKQINSPDGYETFINKHGVVFHIVHLKPVHVVTAEYCPDISKIRNYDFDPGNSFYDQLPINEL